MDRIQKLVSQQLRSQAVTVEPHPDADSLTAFAEKALPDNERAQVLAHLSTCENCRQIAYLALPDAAEAQKVLSPARHPSSFFVLRWGTLAAVLAVGAVLLVGTRRHGVPALYKQKAPEKALDHTAAYLKAPPEVAEMRAARDNAGTRSGTVREPQPNKVIPSPKHMTAKPSAKFDFDQSGEVRFTPSPGAAANGELPMQARNIEDLRQLSVSPAAPQPFTPSAVNGAVLQNAPAANTGQNGLAPVSLAQSNVTGTVLDPSGAVISNAMVTIGGPIGTRAVQSDAEGKFAFNRLSPGSYSVQVQAPGFKKTELSQIAVLVNKESNLQVTLQPGAVAETVEVSAASRLTTDAGATVSANEQAKVTAPPTFETESVNAVVASNKQVESVRKKATGRYHGEVGKSLSFPQPQWSLSDTGAVQRSVDAGRSWQSVPVSSAVFRALSAEGAHVWAGGNAGLLYHSADAGQTWTKVTPVAVGRKLSADITRIEFSDAQNGTVTTIAAEIWTTSDGGQSWSVK